jgi:hypothetical protein
MQEIFELHFSLNSNAVCQQNRINQSLEIKLPDLLSVKQGCKNGLRQFFHEEMLLYADGKISAFVVADRAREGSAC